MFMFSSGVWGVFSVHVPFSDYPEEAWMDSCLQWVGPGNRVHTSWYAAAEETQTSCRMFFLVSLQKQPRKHKLMGVREQQQLAVPKEIGSLERRGIAWAAGQGTMSQYWSKSSRADLGMVSRVHQESRSSEKSIVTRQVWHQPRITSQGEDQIWRQ